MYRNQMGPNYKHDGRKFKNIINTGVIMHIVLILKFLYIIWYLF